MARADLARIMGGKSRVSEFFAGKRDLSISQVRALRDELGIPADLLIPPAA
jgi:HTH-type transcriptional regulator/antitoxin HigA